MTIEKHPSAPSVAPELLERLRDLQVALISDQLHRNRGFAGLRPYHQPGAARRHRRHRPHPRRRQPRDPARLRVLPPRRRDGRGRRRRLRQRARRRHPHLLRRHRSAWPAWCSTARSATSPRSASGPSRSTPAATPIAAPTRTARARSTSPSSVGGMTVQPGRHRRRRPGRPARLRARGGRGPDRQGHRPPREGGADHRRDEGRPLGPLVHRRRSKAARSTEDGRHGLPALRPHRPPGPRHRLEPGHRPRAGRGARGPRRGGGPQWSRRGQARRRGRSSRRPRVQGRDGALRRHRPGGGGRRCRGGRWPTARSTSSSTTPACSSARPSRTFRSTSGSSS